MAEQHRQRDHDVVRRVGEERPQRAVALLERRELRPHLRRRLVEGAGQVGDLVAAADAHRPLVVRVRGTAHVGGERADAPDDRPGGEEDRRQEHRHHGHRAPDEAERPAGGRPDPPGQDHRAAPGAPSRAHRHLQPVAVAVGGHEAAARLLRALLEHAAQTGGKRRRRRIGRAEIVVIRKGAGGKAVRRAREVPAQPACGRIRQPRPVGRRHAGRCLAHPWPGRWQEVLRRRLAAFSPQRRRPAQGEIAQYANLVALGDLVPRPGDRDEQRHRGEDERQGQPSAQRHVRAGLSRR